MKTNKPGTHKRVIAYLIDLIIITLLSGILTVVIIDNTKYEEKENELVELLTKFTNKEITQEEYLETYDNLNYELTKESVGVTVITCVMSLVYYVVLCYYCKGVTLGKYFMKIRIVSNNGKKLTILNYFLRSLVINMILSHALTILLIKVLSKSQFISVYTYVQNALSILILASLLLIMYRNDGRGIEDFMGNTKVINFKDEELEKEEVKEEVKDAVIVEEKKRGRNKKEVK